MGGFWTSETMHLRLPAEDLIKPFEPVRVVSGAYELGLGAEVFVTSDETRTKRLLDPDEQFRIPPGQFANLLTEEVVTIPNDALGLISVKFRLKQRGLVNVSGFHVDPGFSAPLLFSVYNAGPMPVVIARGEAAFLLWFCSLDQATADLYDGEHGASGITSRDVMQLDGEIATPQALALRLQKVENRLDQWAATGVTVAKAVLGVVVAAVFAWLVSIAARAIGDDKESPKGTTTTTTPISFTTTTIVATTFPSAPTTTR